MGKQMVFLGSCSRLNAFETGNTKKKNIRSPDHPAPIIPPYPRAPSAIFNVLPQNGYRRGWDVNEPRWVHLGWAHIFLPTFARIIIITLTGPLGLCVI